MRIRGSGDGQVREIFLKSETVKRRYISIMTGGNIGLALEAEGLTHRIETYRGRIMIYGDEPPRRIAVAAAKTSGGW